MLRDYNKLNIVLSGAKRACPPETVVAGQLGGCEVLDRGKSAGQLVFESEASYLNPYPWMYHRTYLYIK